MSSSRWPSHKDHPPSHSAVPFMSTPQLESSPGFCFSQGEISSCWPPPPYCNACAVNHPDCDPWTVAHPVPPSMGFPRQEYWSGWPSPAPGDLPDPGIEPPSLMSPSLAGGSLTTEPPGQLSLLQ